MNRIIPLLCCCVMFCVISCSRIPKIVRAQDPLTAEENNDLGFAYERQNKPELAEKEYLKAARKRKDWAVPRFNLGNVYFKKGDHESAIKMYREALVMDPACTDCMNNLAWVLCRQGEYDQAGTHIRRALRLKKNREYEKTLDSIERRSCR